MNYMIKICLTALIGVTLISSCDESFLDEEVRDSFAPSSLKDELGFEAAVVGLHHHYSTWLTTGSNQSLPGMSQVGTDIVWAPSGRAGGVRAYYDYATLTPEDSPSQRLWSYLYKMIGNANVLIQNAEGEEAELTQEQKDGYNAEARFFRAYAYNMLATLYGDVPLLTEPVVGARTDFTRTPLSEVNKQIEEDLLFAADHLPTIDNARYEARANQDMARQLLAEVYLRMDKPDLAEEQADAIINSGRFSLVTERYGVQADQPGDAFSDMFFVGNMRRSQGNTEAIWVLEVENPTDVPGGSSGPSQYRRVWGGAYHDLPGMVPADSLGGRGLTRIRLNNWVLYGLYEPGDMRNSRHSIKRQQYFNNPDPKYDPIRGFPVPYGQDAEFTLADESVIKIFAADTIYKYAPYTLKWKQFDPRDTFGWGMWKDFLLMRLGETYLLRAEARFKQGDLAGAAEDINKLRDRANASNVAPGDVDLNLILDERARELVAEENRRMTLVRTGTLVERARRLTGTEPLAGGEIETTNGLQDHHMLLPIPQSEIELNKDAELKQNPNYN